MPASTQRLLSQNQRIAHAKARQAMDESPDLTCEACHSRVGAGICTSCGKFLCDACCVGRIRSGIACDNCGLMLCHGCCADGSAGIHNLNLEDCSGCREIYSLAWAGGALHRPMEEMVGEPIASARVGPAKGLGPQFQGASRAGEPPAQFVFPAGRFHPGR